MLEQLVAAFDRQDYKTAAALLQQLQQQTPDSPWVKLYAARLREVAGKLESAKSLYRQLLQGAANSKVIAQARQGLQRIGEQEQAKQRSTIAESEPSAPASEPGVLILEAIDLAHRQTAAQQFAAILKLDAYTARLLLPSRGWRLYRVGPIHELQTLGQALQRASIPTFWRSLSTIQAIRVFRVHSISAIAPQISVICANEAGQLGSLGFNWSEVSNRVEGRLPIFEEVVDRRAWNQLTRKEKTQDYAQVIDLHLPNRGCILRFADWSYQFQQGIVFDANQDGSLPTPQSTNRLRWNQLVHFLDDRLVMVPVWSEFPQFAETALEHLTFINSLPAHIDLFRKAPSKWDLAFQLYSGLVLEQNRA
ncbi:MAG: tetratricopeptide repeat protein [Elainella sp. Prado103]|jgi:hypothetical protein|nr:tetratricopeptide repeat protein [Elainella sp. Prado103]